jgi:hypothetical protein
MAEEAGLYLACWRPEEVGLTKASHLLPLLRQGLAQLRSDPDYYRGFNPPNGWGSYEGFVEFVEAYLQACETWPDAAVSVDR